MKRARLEEFRQAAYKHLCRAKDATFELTDAIFIQHPKLPPHTFCFNSKLLLLNFLKFLRSR